MSTPQLCQHAAVKEVSHLPTFSPRLKEPKVVVIREEFIALTGDPLIAAVLNQLVYWSQRVTTLDLFLKEEKASPPQSRSSLQHGWFYKTSSELIEETMLCVTPVTLRRYLNFLEERGWIETRTNPQNKWDRTTQYRVNLRKLCIDLQAQGYTLPGFLKDELFPKFQNAPFEGKEMRGVRAERPKVSREEKNDLSKLQNKPFEGKENSDSNRKKQGFEGSENDPSNAKKLTSRMENNLTCNTEITTENTNREHTQRTRVRENLTISEEMVVLWERHVGQKILHLTVTRKDQLESLFSFHFQNDMRLWERFCLQVKGTPFLMGGGANGWRVTLDWILRDGSVLKVLEGNYGDLGKAEHDGESNPARQAEKAAIIASIKDPVWRDWCSQLAEGVCLNEQQMLQPPLSLTELQEIANAYFIECEGKKLVWVGSDDPKVLKKIEDLRLKINWVFAKQYPKARTFRTRLEPINSLKQDADQLGSDYLTTSTKGENHA